MQKKIAKNEISTGKKKIAKKKILPKKNFAEKKIWQKKNFAQKKISPKKNFFARKSLPKKMFAKIVFFLLKIFFCCTNFFQ